jgi:hypothetical protein
VSFDRRRRVDTTVYTKNVGLEGYEASLNPVNSVPKLITMPQHHYLAQMDDVVPNLVYHSYAQAFGDNRCLQHTVAQNVLLPMIGKRLGYFCKTR